MQLLGYGAVRSLGYPVEANIQMQQSEGAPLRVHDRISPMPLPAYCARARLFPRACCARFLNGGEKFAYALAGRLLRACAPMRARQGVQQPTSSATVSPPRAMRILAAVSV